MNKRIVYGLSSAVLAAAVLAGPAGVVWAVDSPATGTANNTTNTTTSNAATTGATGTAGAAQSEELRKRAQERVTQLKTKLNAAETARIKLKCTNAQGRLKSMSGRIQGIQTSRSEVYDATIARLSQLATRLTRQGVDASQMQTHIDKLKALIATYKTDLETYKTAVDDASKLDCTADPTAFKAALEQARTAQASVAKDVAAVRTYVLNDVKTYVGGLRTQIKSTTGGSN